MVRKTFALVVACLAIDSTGPALAESGVSTDGYYCPYGSYIGNGRCSDGTIAVYRGPSPQAQPSDNASRIPRKQVRVELQGLLGKWSTDVPGAVWTTPSVFPGWQTLNVAPGALSGLLVIYPDGRYVWNAYGGKRSTWVRSGDPEYPILLLDPAEGRKWKVGLNAKRSNSIYIVESNGYFWYEGRRP